MAGGGVVVGGLSKKYNGKLTFYIYFVVIMGACGGLLLGYDNGKSPGARAKNVLHDLLWTGASCHFQFLCC